jgi:hypothetical protein
VSQWAGEQMSKGDKEILTLNTLSQQNIPKFLNFFSALLSVTTSLAHFLLFSPAQNPGDSLGKRVQPY